MWEISSLMSRTMLSSGGGQFDPALDEWETEVVDFEDDPEAVQKWAEIRHPTAFKVLVERLPDYVNPLDRFITPDVSRCAPVAAGVKKHV